MVLVLIFSFLSFLFFVNIYEYKIFNKNFNDKISAIMYKIEEKYPDISESELMDVLYSYENSDILKKYSIDMKNDILIFKNEKALKKSLVVNLLFYLFSFFIVLYLFFEFIYNRNKEIDGIVKCIEEINKKNYKLDLDEFSEGQLSILKSEIYKITIMLKEEAENSKNDKLELKNSLSDISHQLKTPLTSILISIDNIIDDPDMDKDVREDFIRNIKRELTNVTFLVQSILKLSKFDTNTVEFFEEKVSLENIIFETKKNLSMLCDLKNINLDISIRNSSIIICDFKWQVEALTNIVKNCIEHSNENSCIFIVLDSNKLYAQIEITDNGCGIDRSDIPHIFERFYRGKNSSSDSVGIGLALSKKIIEKDNGKISVDSNKSGSKFTIKYFY